MQAAPDQALQWVAMVSCSEGSLCSNRDLLVTVVSVLKAVFVMMVVFVVTGVFVVVVVKNRKRSVLTKY